MDFQTKLKLQKFREKLKLFCIGFGIFVFIAMFFIIGALSYIIHEYHQNSQNDTSAKKIGKFLVIVNLTVLFYLCIIVLKNVLEFLKHFRFFIFDQV